MQYLGDVPSGQSVHFYFSSYKADGTPMAPSGASACVYKGSSTTEDTSGVTLTVSSDGVVGLNRVDLMTTAAFYEPANDYSVVISSGTVNGVSVVGRVLAHFSIDNRVNTTLSNIKAKTDQMQFSGDGDIIATLDGEVVQVG